MSWPCLPAENAFRPFSSTTFRARGMGLFILLHIRFLDDRILLRYSSMVTLQSKRDDTLLLLLMLRSRNCEPCHILQVNKINNDSVSYECLLTTVRQAPLRVLFGQPWFTVIGARYRR
jgi:hypothetical protein